MKYWWLEKYLNLEVKLIPQLFDDIRYFLVMPKNYLKVYEDIKDKDIDSLLENELLINLYVLVSTKKIKNNRILLIIEKLLTYPDTNLPISDYSLKEVLVEIKNLKDNHPYAEKLDNNNIGACYNCREIFYVDLIRAVNRKNYCLCPFCGKSMLYFDNDYIPMNTSFIRLAFLYYGISKLGCRFKEIIKLLKKNVTFTMSNIINNELVITTDSNDKKAIYVDLVSVFDKKIGSFEESIILKKYYYAFLTADNNMIREVSIIAPRVKKSSNYNVALLLIISLMDGLANMTYLKKIKIVDCDVEMYNNLKKIYKEIINFK